MVLQLLAATESTGQLEVRGHDEERRGFLGVSRGHLVSAQFEDEDGYLALGAVFAIDRGDFEFLPQERVERADLSGDLEELLGRATVERERVAGIREVVPDDRVRFRLSERATERGEITLAPAQWRALLLIDGERDVAALAERLSMPRLDAQQLLAALVRAGLIDPITPAAGVDEAARAHRRLPPMQAIPPTQAGERIVLRGHLPDFPLETIVQLLAETRKTGRLDIRGERDTSTLGVAEGRLVSAVSGEENGELGLGLAFTAPEGEFDFVPMAEAPAANLGGALDPLLDRAAGIRDRIVAVRGLIPNERSRFRLSERATGRAEIVLTPEQWRVLLGVNGERDVVAIAEHLGMRRLPVMMVLAELINGGYVDMIPATEMTWPDVERRKTPWPTAAVVTPPVAPPIVEEVTPPAPEVPSPEAEAAAATAEAFAAAPPPTAEPEAPTWEAPPAEPAPPAWEAPSWEAPAPAEPQATEIDPRLAVFGAPTAEPAAPAWEAPAPEAPPWETPAPPAWETPAPEAPVAEPPAAVEVEAVVPPETAPAAEIAAPPIVAPPARPEKKKGLFGGLFRLGLKPAAVVAAPLAPPAGTRSGQLATFANELVAAYNSGQYGKGRVEGRMLTLIMRADEQADPIDRPLPITNDRLDVGTIDRDPPPERQALPYLAVLVRQIYDEAERALGKDKARRGFRDVRQRLFGKDLTLLQAPEVGGRMPKA